MWVSADVPLVWKKIQTFEEQPIKTNQVYSKIVRKSYHTFNNLSKLLNV